MRLQFKLNQVNISPVCHIQINRHAQEFRDRYAIGQLYGSLYDDEAHITNVLPCPSTDTSREELEAMDRKHQDMLQKYQLDNNNIGWYLISFKQNIWEQLEVVHYYEKFINTSFFLVYDYEARLTGKNPYKAFRLTDDFALREEFNLSEVNSNNLESPFQEIPVQVKKNQIFQAMMLFNKNSLIQDFAKNSNSKQRKDKLANKINAYVQTLQEQTEQNAALIERNLKEKKTLTFSEYCHNMGILLKAQQQEKELRKYEENIKLTQKVLHNF